MHRTFMGHLETGRKDFRLTTLIRVSNALGVTLSDLFSGIEAGKSAAKGRKTRTPVQALDRNRILKELSNVEIALSKLKAIASERKQ